MASTKTAKTTKATSKKKATTKKRAARKRVPRREQKPAKAKADKPKEPTPQQRFGVVGKPIDHVKKVYRAECDFDFKHVTVEAWVIVCADCYYAVTTYDGLIGKRGRTDYRKFKYPIANLETSRWQRKLRDEYAEVKPSTCPLVA